MTDVLDPSTPLPVADESGAALPPNSCVECAGEGRTQSFKTPQALASHRSKSHGIAGSAGDKSKKPAPGLNINVNTSKTKTKAGKEAERVAKTAKGAESFANMVAAGCQFINQPEDAVIVAANAGAFGAAVGELSQYQPWLSSVFAPGGEMTGEVAAWLGLVAVAGAIMVPIGARHGWIPEKYAAAFGVAVSAPVAAAADSESRAA